MAEARDLRDVGTRVEGLLAELRSQGDSGVAERAEELVRLLMELYGAGLERVMEVAAEGGGDLVTRLAGDKFLASLLVLHGLHPVPLHDRVHQALDKVRPYLGSHAGGVDFLGVDDDGVAHLSLQGSCDGCPSSTITVKMAIEKAIFDVAPEVVRVEVEGMVEPPPPPGQTGDFVSVDFRRSTPAGAGNAVPVEIRRSTSAGAGATAVGIGRKPGNGTGPTTGGWAKVAGLDSLEPGTTRSLDIGGASVLICAAQGNLYAYRNACASCGGPLDDADLKGDLLSCAVCGSAFDVRRAGREVAGGGLHLDPLPLLTEGDEVRIAVGGGAG